MASFGKQSEAMLKGVDPRLVKICRMAVEVLDFQVLDGVRTLEEQRINVLRGKSKTMDSKHLHGRAVDLAPYPIDWTDTEMFCVLAGVMKSAAHAMGVRLRWGGDWDSDNSTRDERFRDYGHFELVD